MMNKILEAVGAILTGAVVATGSVLEIGCDAVKSTSCTAGAIVTNVAESVVKTNEEKSKNNSLGNQ